MPTPINPSRFPTYIYGLHDLGGPDDMLSAHEPGWVLDSVELRAQTSTDYSSLGQAGLGVIVRLNHGYDTAGTIPPSNQYDAFAARCAAYVARSPGACVWLIGNEMNLSAERPQLPDGSREVITPEKYVECFGKCYTAIKNVPGHADDLVIPGAVGPYNDETGDWVEYLVGILNLAGTQVDGIALHCYTHDFHSDQITSDDWMDPPYNNRHFNFRAYRDFLNALPAPLRSLPVFITETNPYAGWRDANIGWIQAAYREIDSWNGDSANQPVQALVLFRWQTLPDHPEWGIQDKPALVADFQAALRAGYRVRWPGKAPTPPTPPIPDYRARWSQTVTPPNNTMTADHALTGRVVVVNAGGKTWQAAGASPVRVGYQWYDAQGREIPIAPNAGDFALERDIPPGGTAIFSNVELRAPQVPGMYTLKWDLHEGVTRFSARGSPTRDAVITVTASALPPEPPKPTRAQWAASFLAHDTPAAMLIGQSLGVNLRVKNMGVATWVQGGSNPVHVGYKWFNAAGQQQLDVEDRRTALPTDIAPNQEISFGVTLASPKTPGHYTLRWDLVAERITWFADAGNPPLIVPVIVTTLPKDISGWRAESNLSSIHVAHALDGDTRTFWDGGTPQAVGQWFRLNLSVPRLVDGIQFLSPGRGFPAGYALRISGDGHQWTEVARVPSDNTYDLMAVFAPQVMQYAQINLLTAAASSWMISEILIHAASAWTASASHNPGAAYLAIDNRAETAWTSGEPQAPGMWFQLDLGRVETVSGLELVPPSDENPVGLRIAVWNANASRWQVVYEKLDNAAAVDAIFTATRTQFVNVQLLQEGDRPWAIRHARVIRELDTWLGPTP